MRVSVFVGTSVDGFIARQNDSFDFLSPEGDVPHGFEEFFATVDTLVIGRKTFEVVAAFPDWPYGEKRVVVLSTQPLDFSRIRGGRVEQLSGPPSEIVASLSAQGVQHVYLDGGITIQRFLDAGLVDSLTITCVPVLIGEGIPLFGRVSRDIRLHHVATRHYSTGLVQTEYTLKK